MTTTAKTAAPKRARKPKAETVETLSLTIDSAEAQKMIDAARSDLMAQIEPGLTLADLKAKLDETSDIRTRIVGEVERLTASLTKMQGALIGVDGALQVLGQLIEVVEAKGKGEA